MAIPLVIVAAVILGFIICNNAVIRAKNALQNAYSTIDVMLKKRYDLIPNLVEVVKQYAKHESSVFSNVTELRSRASNPNLSNDEKITLIDQLTTGLRQVMVLSENYPELKANENFLQLQRAWNEMEEQISAARRS
jgi:LemA protein